MAYAVHCGLQRAVGRHHDDFDLAVCPFDFLENFGSRGIRQLEVEGYEIHAMIIDDGQGTAAVFGRQNVEILLQNLGQGGAGRRFVVNDQDSGSVVDRALCDRVLCEV